MSRLVFAPEHVSATTDSDGKATLRLRAPGTFAGLVFDPAAATPGLIVKLVEIWADLAGALDGDVVSNMRVEDDLGILSAIPDAAIPGHYLSARFADYPIILRFGDAAPISPAEDGIMLRPGDKATIASIDATQTTFLPAGFSIVGDFQSAATEGKSGRVVRCNVSVGEWR